MECFKTEWIETVCTKENGLEAAMVFAQNKIIKITLQK